MNEPYAEAERILDWLKNLDATWKNRIEALVEERKLEPLQVIGVLCSWSLENGMHMEIPVLPQLLDGFSPAGTTAECPQCLTEYVMEYPGKPYCGNDCADAARRGEPPKYIVIDDGPSPEEKRRMLTAGK